MNLFFRLVWLAIVGQRRSRVSVLGPCRTPFRVLPTDLDVLRHVNNGVYFSLMDLARVDLMRRAGLFAQLARRGWYPVVMAETIQFRRSLKLFQRFDIVTRVLTWDEKGILVEQRFERGGETIARAILRSRFLSRKGGSVPTDDILALSGIAFAPAPIPELDQDARWNADNSSWIGDRAAPAELPAPPTRSTVHR